MTMCGEELCEMGCYEISLGEVTFYRDLPCPTCMKIICDFS